MSNNADEQKPLSPYSSFKTLLGFIGGLKKTILPDQVDLGVLRSYSGSVAKQLITTLKYLALIEENGTTTTKLNELVDAYETPQWKPVLSKMMTEAYSPILGELNLQKATKSQVEEKFRTWGAQGDVLNKCMAFFIAAMTEAGVTLSPHIRVETRGRPKGSRTIKPPKEPGEEKPDVPTQPGTVRFSLPIPDKPTGMIQLPTDVALEDWEMIDSMIRAYIQRKEKAAK